MRTRLRDLFTRLLAALQARSWRSYTAGFFLALSILANGVDHGHIYSREVTEDRHVFFGWAGIHTVDTVQEGAYYALAFLAARNPLAVVGASMASRIGFQAPINLAAGKPALWAPEVYTLRVAGEVIFSRPVPPWARGAWQIAWSIAGLLLYVFHAPVGRLCVRLARRAFSTGARAGARRA